MAALLHALVPGLAPLEVRSDACANCHGPCTCKAPNPFVASLRERR